MKFKFDLQNKKYLGFMISWFGYLILLFQIMEFESERRLPGFIALAIVLISSVIMTFSTAHRLKMVFICVWVGGVAFLLGYLLTTLILE